MPTCFPVFRSNPHAATSPSPHQRSSGPVRGGIFSGREESSPSKLPRVMTTSRLATTPNAKKQTQECEQATKTVCHIKLFQKPFITERKIMPTKDLKAGDVLTVENLRAIRPGLGLPTKYLEAFIGKTVLRDVQRGTALNWDLCR